MQTESVLQGHLCCSVSVIFVVVSCLLFGCCEAKLIADELYPLSALDIDSPSSSSSSSSDEPVLVQKYGDADLDQPGFFVKGRPDPSAYYGFSFNHKRWQPTGIDLKDAYRKMANAIVQHRKTLRSQDPAEPNRQRRWDNGVLYPDLRTRLTAEKD